MPYDIQKTTQPPPAGAPSRSRRTCGPRYFDQIMKERRPRTDIFSVVGAIGRCGLGQYQPALDDSSRFIRPLFFYSLFTTSVDSRGGRRFSGDSWAPDFISSSSLMALLISTANSPFCCE